MLQILHPQHLSLHGQTGSNYRRHHHYHPYHHLKRRPSSTSTSAYISQIRMPSAVEPIISRGWCREPASIKKITATATATPAAAPTASPPDQEPKPFRLMDLPAEVRLQIYDAYLSTPHPHLNRARLVLIGERTSSFTSRSRYSALGVNPVWENRRASDGPDRRGSSSSRTSRTSSARNLTTLFTVSRQIHAEAAHHFYTLFTFLFTDSFDPERTRQFLSSLSSVQRGWIHHVGFEVVFSVHYHRDHPVLRHDEKQDEVVTFPKRRLAVYQAIPPGLSEELSALRSVLLYMTPGAYEPCDRSNAERGVLQLAGYFAGMGKEVKLLPVLERNRKVIERAERDILMIHPAGGLRELVPAPEKEKSYS